MNMERVINDLKTFIYILVSNFLISIAYHQIHLGFIYFYQSFFFTFLINLKYFK